jgi:hypothetical protein
LGVILGRGEKIVSSSLRRDLWPSSRIDKPPFDIESILIVLSFGIFGDRNRLKSQSASFGWVFWSWAAIPEAWHYSASFDHCVIRKQLA